LKNWIADPAFGIVLANADETAIESAASVGGRAWLYENDGDGRIAAFSPSPAERSILEKLKQSFDPDGRLAPLPW
jgi:FAD/FMN-containing dehydrogenase